MTNKRHCRRSRGACPREGGEQESTRPNRTRMGGEVGPAPPTSVRIRPGQRRWVSEHLTLRAIGSRITLKSPYREICLPSSVENSARGLVHVSHTVWADSLGLIRKLHTRCICHRLSTTHIFRHPSKEHVKCMDMAPKLEWLIDAIVHFIPLETIELPGEFFPAHLPVAVMDAVFRTRCRYRPSSVPAAERYCRKFGLASTREDRWNPPPVDQQETLGDLVRRHDELGPDKMTTEVFELRCSFPKHQARTVESVLHVARALQSIGSTYCRTCRLDTSMRSAKHCSACPGLASTPCEGF